MPAWSELRGKLDELSPRGKTKYLDNRARRTLRNLTQHSGRNVIFYASAFLQKPFLPGRYTGLDLDDINGMMAGVHKQDASKGLLLILHTPGGMVGAADSIVGYLRDKFRKIDAVVPVYAMSAGTMIALACDQIHMDRQSQLGPTDPYLAVAGSMYSAHSILVQFEEAKEQIIASPNLASLWTPILQFYGPALLVEARRAIEYGDVLISGWLKKYMFSNLENGEWLSSKAAEYFGGISHPSHARRISRDDARAQGIRICNLEEDNIFQDLILTLYHISTLFFEHSSMVKLVLSSNGKIWDKYFEPT